MGSVEGFGGLGGRLVLLESLVKGLLPEAELSSNDEIRQEAKILGIPLPVVEDEYGESEKNSTRADESALPLLPDQQGQVQYIGPASSFAVHLKLRKLMESYDNVGFVMFGKNAAEPDESEEMFSNFSPVGGDERDQQGQQMGLVRGTSDCSSPSDTVREIDGPVLDTLIDTYFDAINPDFPVLHESSFREAYENWCTSSNAPADPAFLCVMLAVLILSRPVATISIPVEAERKWWGHIKKLLPTVFFTSTIPAVQALMLTALYLHCTNQYVFSSTFFNPQFLPYCGKS